MKYIFVTVVLIGFTVGSVVLLNNKKEIKDIKSFSFDTVDGMAINAGVKYSIKLEENKYIATIRKNGKSEEDETKKEIFNEKVKELENILNKYNVSKWNGFNKSNKNVLDGHSFSLSIKLGDDSYVSASGYMRWPKNYKNVRNELKEFFEKL